MGGRTKRELEDENAELRDALDDVYERIGDALGCEDGDHATDDDEQQDDDEDA
jgi:hypothetical protein